MSQANTGWRRGVTAALLMLVAAVAAPARGGEDGYQITPSGLRMPVYGSFLGEDGAECRRLTAFEVESRELARLTSRSVGGPPVATVSAGVTAVEFQIRYSDPAGTGFDDPALGEQRRAAMQAALASWSRVLVGTVPIVVEARFLDSSDSPDTLASASPTDLVQIGDRFVAWSLAAQLGGASVNGGGADLTIQFNPAISWDYVLNGVNGAGSVGFVYTAIHEVGHGLGFIDSFDSTTGQMLNGLPFAFDVFVNRGSGAADPVAGHAPAQLLLDIVSDDLFFGGPNAIAASAASIRPLPMIKLFAPNPYQQGSSVAHLDQETYSDVRTGLMVPSDFGPGFDRVDLLALAIMADMGYVTDPSGAVQ